MNVSACEFCLKPPAAWYGKNKQKRRLQEGGKVNDCPEKHSPTRSPGEELANTLTHGLGIGLAIAALVLLVVFASLRGTVWHVVSCAIYGATLVFLYSASTAYHGFRSVRIKSFFRRLDHSGIFLLIAGTYTPFLLVTLRGPWGWSLFGTIWGLAVVGVILECVAVPGLRYVSVPIYLAMGWLALLVIRPMTQNLSPTGMMWVWIGGGAYSIGVIFYLLKRRKFAHTVWHLFVIAGSVCHFFAVLFYVIR